MTTKATPFPAVHVDADVRRRIISPDIERAARALCKHAGDDPDMLEPGNTPYCDDEEAVDGTLPNGDKAHYAWRGYVNAASDALQEAGDA